MNNIVNGNILDYTTGIIGQQCNCQLVMGAGLAKQIRNIYPRVFQEYTRVMGQISLRHRLGRCQMVEVIPKKLLVANLFGQFHFRPRGRQHTDYNALAMALRSLVKWHKNHCTPAFPIYLPYGIGCDLAGGDWNVVQGIIQDTIPSATIVKYRN